MNRMSQKDMEQSRLAKIFTFMVVMMLAFLLGFIAAGVRFTWA